MKEIENREDVFILVSTFYIKIRKDAILGPIFNGQIPEGDWPKHLDILTDFWVTNLFGIPCFKGNPTQTHKNLDKLMHHTMEQKHFEQWLLLWFETIDSLFLGNLADRAKNSARNMANGQFMAVWNNRPNT